MFKKFHFLSFLPFLLTGCEVKEDPELVKELEEIKAEVKATEAELDAVEAEMKEIRITDPSEELTTVKLEIEEAAAQKAALEEEIQKLGEARKKANEDLAAYKQKYRLR